MSFLLYAQNWVLKELFSFFNKHPIVPFRIIMICPNSDMSLNVGLLKNKICPTNLISSLDRVRSLVGRGNATDKACLYFRKTCDHVLWCPHGKMKIGELGES